MYLIAEIYVRDTEVFAEYLHRIPEFVEKYQGRYLVKGGLPNSIEGDWCPEQVVLIEFENNSNLVAFIADPAVKKLFSLRRESTISRVISVIGCD